MNEELIAELHKAHEPREDRLPGRAYGGGTFVAHPGSNPVLYSGAPSAQWWGGRVVAVPAEGSGSSLYAQSGVTMTGLSFLHDNQSYDYIAADDDGHVTIVQTKLGIDPGPGAVLALQAQALMYSQALESARSWMRSQLLLDEVEEGVISLGPPAGRSALDDPAEWDEADEEPRWLAITDLPFRGGGVMSRHRPHR